MKSAQIDVKAAGLTLGVLTALWMLVIQYYPTVTGAVFDGNNYGSSLQFIIEDLYPWYKHSSGLMQSLLGVVFGFIDGFVGGVVLAWVYNKFAGNK